MGHALVTGATGLVGTSVVSHLLAEGWQVTVAVRRSRVNERKIRAWRGQPGFAVVWADLADGPSAARVVGEARPDVIVHLAAVIPPGCYRHPSAARAVAVSGTEHLVAAAAALADPPRFVLASSMGVYGPRNPHRDAGLIGPDTPTAPGELYGALKSRSEEIVRGSGLDWQVLRLGAVLAPNPMQVGMRAAIDLMTFEAALPSDGRVHTVHVADAARAFGNAAGQRGDGRTHLIGGDDSHRRLQHQVTADMAAALGLPGAIPPGRPGDPGDDSTWYAIDWLDTSAAQQALDFQRHTWDDLLADVRAEAGWRRGALRPLTPLVRAVMRRRSPDRGRPGRYADPLGAIRRTWGDPAADVQ